MIAEKCSYPTGIDRTTSGFVELVLRDRIIL